MDGLHEGLKLAGRYLLTKPLRGGGNADVWHAMDEQSGAAKALKFSRTGSTSELLAEYENLRTLSHPAVVKAHDLVTDDGTAFLVLELIEGVELGQYRGAGHTVWLPMIQRVAEALTHVHGRSVAHGDLKLDNILVSRDGQVHLIDFAGRAGQSQADDVRALGVMMTELASGLRCPDQLPSRVPASLARLITDIRDGGLTNPGAVAGRIDDVLNGNMKPGAPEQFERIKPVSRQAPADRGTPEPVGRQNILWPWVAGAGVVVIIAVAMLTFWPRMAFDPGAEAMATTAADPADPAEPGSPDRVEQARARLEELSQTAQKKSYSVYQKWLTLEAMDVSTWAGLRAQRAFELLQEGERLVSDLDHVAALRLLGESEQIFDALLEQAPGIAADRREAGWQAYRTGDAATAALHFRVSLAIEPDQDEVREALDRTAFLDSVLTLTRKARDLEEQGDLRGALAAMNEAFRIDADNAEVETQIARLKAALEAAEFQSTMSGFYTAMRNNDRATARRYLRRASELRASAPEVLDARTQLELADRTARTASLRTRALDAENAENWEKAIELYSELLVMDPALVIAQQGRDRSRRLAALTTRAETLLNTALIKDDIRREADDLLEQIENVEASAPALHDLARQLEDALRLSRLPVTVRLESDNLTEVRVHRVARLGMFERHELELMPGQYTIVGTRVGYRDVRAELIVEAGKEPEPMFIRCEEQI